jgi:hypothetical protein
MRSTSLVLVFVASLVLVRAPASAADEKTAAATSKSATLQAPKGSGPTDEARCVAGPPGPKSCYEWLTPSAESYCFLTTVAWVSQGRVMLSIEDNAGKSYWKLIVTATGNGQATGGARCVRY